MSEGQGITLYDRARTMLSQAKTIDEAKAIVDAAEQLRFLARQANDTDLLADATELRLRAQRKLGERLVEIKDEGRMARGGRPNRQGVRSQAGALGLAQIGINHKLSMIAQQRAKLSDVAFEAIVEEAREKVIVRHPRTVGDATRRYSRKLAEALGYVVLGQDVRDYAFGELRAVQETLERQAQFVAAVSAAVGRPTSTAQAVRDCISDTRLTELATVAGLAHE